MTRARIIAVLAPFYLLPLFVQVVPEDGTLRLRSSRPHVISGDEPHYLVAVTSLVADGDLDVTNNYDRAEFLGTEDAGKRFRHAHLDRAVHLGGPTQPLAMPGLIALLAAAALPFRGTRYVEAACVVAVAVLVLAAIAFLHRLLAALDPRRAGTTVLLLALGTPLWHYAGRLFPEALCVLALAVAIERLVVADAPLAAGVALGAGALAKLPFGVIPLAIACDLALRRDGRRLIRFIAGPAAALLLLFAYDTWLFGDPLRLPGTREFSLLDPRNIPSGLGGLLFSETHGILLFSPLLLLAALGAARRGEPEGASPPPSPSPYADPAGLARLLLLATLPYIAVICSYRNWHGGACYSARYLVPLLVALAIPLHRRIARREGWSAGAALVLGWSLLVNAQAAFVPRAFFGGTPWGLVAVAPWSLDRAASWSGPALQGTVGALEGAEWVVPADAPAGFVHGEFVRLGHGVYEATFEIALTPAPGPAPDVAERPYVDLYAAFACDGWRVARREIPLWLATGAPAHVEISFQVGPAHPWLFPWRAPPVMARVFRPAGWTLRVRGIAIH